jgi:hypothetical protein
MDDMWKAFLSGLDLNLPENGIKPPEAEIIEQADEGDINGSLIKVSFDIIMFMNHDQSKYFMMNGNQVLTQMGEMTLKEALLKFNKKPPRKKRS